MSNYLKAAAAGAHALAFCVAIYLLPGCSPLPQREEPTPMLGSVPDGLVAEDDGPADTLKVEGLGPQNTITGAALRFRVEGVAELDPEASIGMAVNDKTRTFVPLASRWHRDDATGSLMIAEDDVRSLMKQLPDGQVTVILGLAGRDGELAVNVQFKASKWPSKEAKPARS
jgi:hypothetical protein